MTQYIVRELSGTGEKSYENPRIKTELGKESQGTKASTVTMMDLSQSFLVEYILERATLVNKRLEEMKQQKKPQKHRYNPKM